MANSSTKNITSTGSDLIFWQVFIASRPVHWIKNLSLFAALIFSGNLFSEYHFNTVVIAFIAFSLAT